MSASDASSAAPILLTYDGSEDAERAIRGAARLLGPRDAVVLHVSKSSVDWGIGPRLGILLDVPGVDEAILERAEQLRDQGVAIATEAGFRARGDLRTTGSAVWRCVLEVATEIGAQLIVAGSHGQRLRDVFSLGSVAHGLVTHSEVPVLVTHQGDEQPALDADAAPRLLIGHDGSERADRAVRAAARLLPGADARVVGVWESPEYWVQALGAGTIGPMILAQHEELRAIVQQHADHGAEIALEAGLNAESAAVEATAGVGNALLAQAASSNAHAIVIGTHGYSTLERVVLGATAHYVVQRADRPVLVVPSHD